MRSDVTEIGPAVQSGSRNRSRTAIAFESVTRTYQVFGSQVRALDGVTIGLAAGSFAAVAGPPAAGKSTLLRCAAGLELPSSGSVWCGQVELTASSDEARLAARHRQVGLLTGPDQPDPERTVADLVGSTSPLLADLGLTGLLERPFGRLTTLQRSHVLLLSLLRKQPEVLIADAVAPQEQAALARMLRWAADALGVTVLMAVTEAAAAAEAHLVLLLRGGQLVDVLPEPSVGRLIDLMWGLDGR